MLIQLKDRQGPEEVLPEVGSDEDDDDLGDDWDAI